MRSDLNEVKRHRVITPQIAPQRNHLLHELRIIGNGPHVQIGFALIPDKPFCRIVDQRVNHGIKKPGRLVGLSPLHVPGLVRVYLLGRLFRHPCLDAGSAPVSFDQSDRHVQHVIQIFPEEVARCTELRDALCRGFSPSGIGVAVVERSLADFAFYGKHPDVFILGSFEDRII